MVFVGGAIIPHGAMIFDGDPNSESSACRERQARLSQKLARDTHQLFKACSHAARLIASKHPDVVLLFTPHGLTLTSGSAVVYMSKKAAGNALWNECWDDITLNISLESNLSGQLTKHLQDQGIQADGLIAHTLMEVPLRWGEVVPLWFVNKAVGSDVKYVIVSMTRPTLSKTSCDSEIPLSQCQRIGASVAAFIAPLKQRVAVVISGDLSHTHPTDCHMPLYLPDKRWNLQMDEEHARQFDESAELWVKSRQAENLEDQPLQDSSRVFEWKDKEAFYWLEKCTLLQNKAKSCGLYGFAVLHSILVTECQKGGTIRSHFFTRCAPTYYGMMCAYFEEQSSNT